MGGASVQECKENEFNLTDAALAGVDATSATERHYVVTYLCRVLLSYVVAYIYKLSHPATFQDLTLSFRDSRKLFAEINGFEYP